MVYIDTSVLVAYYCPEPLSEKVESLLTAQSQAAISTLTEVELFAALSRKVREGEITRRDGSRVASKFISHISHGLYTRLSIEDHHYALARDWMSPFKMALRSLDALHLAVASSENLTLITTDRRLAEFAKALTVECVVVK